MKCSKCGSEIDEKQKYCSNCGVELDHIIKNSKEKLVEEIKRNEDNKIKVNNTQQTNVNTTSPFVNIMSFIIVIVLLFCAWKYFVQPIFFPNDLQKNGYTAEFYAKNYLGDYCKENELEVKAIEENDGIYIVECKTTNSTLKELYGSTFYYGYMPMASGNTYKQHADKTISAVYSMLEK